MGADEEGTFGRLKTAKRTLLDPIIAAHQGRIFKTTGDGMLIEFASAVDSLRCALDIQASMSAHNAGLPDEERIELRVGINIGDIIVDGVFWIVPLGLGLLMAGLLIGLVSWPLMSATVSADDEEFLTKS